MYGIWIYHIEFINLVVSNSVVFAMFENQQVALDSVRWFAKYKSIKKMLQKSKPSPILHNSTTSYVRRIKHSNPYCYIIICLNLDFNCTFIYTETLLVFMMKDSNWWKLLEQLLGANEPPHLQLCSFYLLILVHLPNYSPQFSSFIFIW